MMGISCGACRNGLKIERIMGLGVFFVVVVYLLIVGFVFLMLLSSLFLLAHCTSFSSLAEMLADFLVLSLLSSWKSLVLI